MSESVFVIGAGRIGTALAARDPKRFVLIDRERGWEQLEPRASGPIVLAVRNDDLAEVMERVPAQRHRDLVFVQNGMLRPWLEQKGLSSATRGLLFMAVPSVGAAIQPGQPGSESPFFGRHAQAMVDAFTSVDLPAKLVDAPTFAAIELEKLIWNCAFGLFCQALDCNVGTVVEQHRPRLRLLVAELLTVASPSFGVELELDPLVDRLCEYSRSIPSYRGAVKEWPWRNGWFVATARAQKRRTPTHDMLLLAIGKFGQSSRPGPG
jgi:ketopantoate reductase